jgi:hypothetical protein
MDLDQLLHREPTHLVAETEYLVAAFDPHVAALVCLFRGALRHRREADAYPVECER